MHERKKNMAVITYEVATDIIIPNITVERKYADGVLMAYRLTANDGYVLHNPNLDSEVEDPITGDMVVERYYYRQATIPKVVPVDSWGFEAVLAKQEGESV
jgi:hypothetical protein